MGKKQRAAIAMLCIVALAGCSSDGTPASEAIKKIIENCSVPVSMEIRVSILGTELAVRCDAMKRKIEVAK